MQDTAYVYNDILGVSRKIRLCVYIYAHMYYICIKKYWKANENSFLWKQERLDSQRQEWK